MLNSLQIYHLDVTDNLSSVFSFYLCNPNSGSRGVAQLASVLAWGARGRKFESSRPDKLKFVIRNLF